MDTPSHQLAVRIIERLLAEKLLRPGDRERMLSKLAEGNVSAEDWRLAVELGQGKDKKK